MKKVNTRNIAEESFESPKRKFAWFSKGVSETLGRNPRSTDLKERHPFDVEILRIPAGKITSSLARERCATRRVRRRSKQVTPSSSDPASRINSSTQAIRTWSSTSSQTIRSARLFIITTARNGRSGHQSGGCFAVNR